LFRFFDFNVVPGKQYAYRVQLGLRNPNSSEYTGFNKVKAAWLKDPSLATDPVLKTKWSDDSDPPPVISVPGDTRILAVSVNKQARDLVGQVLVTKWSRKMGVEAHDKFSVVRGQVVDFPNKTFKPSANVAGAGMGGVGPGMMPAGGVGPGMAAGGRAGPGMAAGGRAGPGMMPAGGPGPGMAPGGRAGPGMMPGGAGGMRPMGPPIAGGVDAPFKVNYFTHAIVLDLHGGELLHEPLYGRRGNSLRLTTPGEILLLDSDGNLVVRNELDDRPTCDEITKNDEGAAGVELAPRPAGVHGGAAGDGGALGNMLNDGGTSRRRPSARGGH
jgi:hypothetical protein